MVGNNMVKLCQAEMIAAMQEYLDKRFVTSPGRVTNIRNDVMAHSFEIEITDVDAGAAIKNER